MTGSSQPLNVESVAVFLEGGRLGPFGTEQDGPRLGTAFIYGGYPRC